MKIVQLVFHLGPGGAEKIVTDLSNELAVQGNDVVAIMLRDPDEGNYGFNVKYLSPSVKLVCLNIKTGFRPSDIRIVEKSILEENPDIVHCHLNVLPYIWSLSLRKKNIRFFHTIHSVATFDIASKTERKVARYFYQRTIRPVAISKICRDSFEEEYGFKPEMIYNGRSAQALGPDKEGVCNELASLQRPVFVHVGRYSEEKNQRMLLEAAKCLKEEGYSFSLVLIGSGYESSDLLLKNKDENIRFLGAKTNVADYLCLCDAFCLPSLIEGCPVSLIEALSCGITPVCTPAGGIPDMIEDGVTGYLSKNFSPECFSNAMKRFMSAPLEKDTLIGHYEKNFSISRCAEEYTKLFAGNMKPDVLFLAPLPPPVHGSAMVSDIIRKSEKINRHFNCHFIDISLSSKVSEIGKMSLPKFCLYTKSLFKTLHLLLHNRFDLCYIALTCHGKGFLKDAPFALLCKMFGKKLVIHQHNKGMYPYSDRTLYRSLLKAVYKDAGVILLSGRLYDDISKIVSEDQVAICHNGIGESIHSEVGANAGNNPVKLLFLSNLIPSKGLPELLEACALVNNAGYNFECHIAGKETNEYSCEKLSSTLILLGLEDKVFYDGCKYGKDKDASLESADIFVFPTRYPNECFPLVLLEAMQHSLPVITTDEGGIPDIIQDHFNGLIIKKNDPKSLAEAIEKLIKNPETRQRMGAAGRKKYEEEFTQDIFEDNLIYCLDKALK